MERRKREELRQQRESTRRPSPGEGGDGDRVGNHYQQQQQAQAYPYQPHLSQRHGPLSPSRAFASGTLLSLQTRLPWGPVPLERTPPWGAVPLERTPPGRSHLGGSFPGGPVPMRDLPSGPHHALQDRGQVPERDTPSSRAPGPLKVQVRGTGAGGGGVHSRGGQSPARDSRGREQLTGCTTSRGMQSPSREAREASSGGPQTPHRIGVRSQSVYTPSRDRPHQPGTNNHQPGTNNHQPGTNTPKGCTVRLPPTGALFPSPPQERRAQERGPGKRGQSYRGRPGSPRVYLQGSPHRGPRTPQPLSLSAGERGAPGNLRVHQGAQGRAACEETSRAGAGAGARAGGLCMQESHGHTASCSPPVGSAPPCA